MASSYSSPVNISLEFPSRQFGLVGSLLIEPQKDIISSAKQALEERVAIERMPTFSLQWIDNSFSCGNGRSTVTEKELCHRDAARVEESQEGSSPFAVNTIHLVIPRNRLSKVKLSMERSAHSSSGIGQITEL